MTKTYETGNPIISRIEVWYTGCLFNLEFFAPEYSNTLFWGEGNLPDDVFNSIRNYIQDFIDDPDLCLKDKDKASDVALKLLVEYKDILFKDMNEMIKTHKANNDN